MKHLLVISRSMIVFLSDDAVILAELLEVLMVARGGKDIGTISHGPRSSYRCLKVNSMDETVLSVHVCGEDTIPWKISHTLQKMYMARRGHEIQKFQVFYDPFLIPWL